MNKKQQISKRIDIKPREDLNYVKKTNLIRIILYPGLHQVKKNLNFFTLRIK